MRTEKLVVRVSPVEKEFIRKMAEDFKMSVADYVRAMALGSKWENDIESGLVFFHSTGVVKMSEPPK